jgi:hypothetical protein
MDMSDYRLVTGFIEHLYTQLVTTINYVYNGLTGLHTLKTTITIAHIKSCMFSLVVSR